MEFQYEWDFKWKDGVTQIWYEEEMRYDEKFSSK